MTNPQKFDDLTPEQQAECLLVGSVIIAGYDYVTTQHDIMLRYAQWNVLASRYTDNDVPLSLAIDIMVNVAQSTEGTKTGHGVAGKGIKNP